MEIGRYKNTSSASRDEGTGSKERRGDWRASHCVANRDSSRVLYERAQNTRQYHRARDPRRHYGKKKKTKRTPIRHIHTCFWLLCGRPPCVVLGRRVSSVNPTRIHRAAKLFANCFNIARRGEGRQRKTGTEQILTLRLESMTRATERLGLGCLSLDSACAPARARACVRARVRPSARRQGQDLDFLES